MKIRTDFVTNSSSTSYIFIAIFSEELVKRLQRLIDSGCTFLYDGIETMAEKGVLADNTGSDPMLAALSYIPCETKKRHKIGIQIEMPEHGDFGTRTYGIEDEFEAFMSFIDEKKLSDEEYEEIYDIVRKAKKENRTLIDHGTCMTDGPFAFHFRENDSDRTLFEMNYYNNPVKFIAKNIEEAVIRQSFYTVEKEFFKNSPILKRVVFLQNSVSVISSNAFEKCTSLERIDGIGRVTEIQKEAFLDCVCLQSLDVSRGSSVNIGSSAFENCSSLVSVRLPKEGKIGKAAFRNCTALKDIYIPEGFSKISKDAFCGCNDVTIITEAGSSAHSFATENNIKCITK